MVTKMERVPVAIGIVEGGIGINFGRRHGLQAEEHKEFLWEMLRQMGFVFPETVSFERNKAGSDGKTYVDWMKLRISSGDCQVNNVNPADGVAKLKNYLLSTECEEQFGVVFEVA